MSCKDCEKIQKEAFDKNIPTFPDIAYVRIEEANVALVGCRKHLRILIEKPIFMVKKEEAKETRKLLDHASKLIKKLNIVKS